MELHVLPGRDVRAAGGPPLGDLRQSDELLGRENALRDLAADHHRPVLPLTVDTVHQAERAPGVRRDLAALECLELVDESIQLRLVGEAEPRRTERTHAAAVRRSPQCA